MTKVYFGCPHYGTFRMNESSRLVTLVDVKTLDCCTQYSLQQSNLASTTTYKFSVCEMKCHMDGKLHQVYLGRLVVISDSRDKYRARFFLHGNVN